MLLNIFKKNKKMKKILSSASNIACITLHMFQVHSLSTYCFALTHELKIELKAGNKYKDTYSIRKVI